MSDLISTSACEQARRVAEKSVSAAELCDAYLARIDTLDSELGSYLLVDHEGARAQASAVDAAIASGDAVGPLAGVPIGLKDLLVTKGLETTAGSKILKGWVPPYEGEVVRKLRNCGAVVLGKLNLDEFAMGSSNEHSAVKLCKNPWDLERVPGGSSGGSAAAVSASLCAISLGTDTGGSIRQPASFCGLVGLKPTYGRVSRHGLIAYASSFDQIGPLAKSAEDAALMLEVIAGADVQDATCSTAPVPRYRDACAQNVKGLTIGITEEMGGHDVDGPVSDAISAALADLENAGAKLKRISLPHTKYALPTYYLLATAEASSNLARFDGVRYGLRCGDDEALEEMYGMTRDAGFGPEVKTRIMLGTFALRAGYYDAYYKKAQQVRTRIAEDFQNAFFEVDVIASPTAPTTAFAFGAKKTPIDMYKADVFTLSCNLAGLPGLSMNCGFDNTGMPIGLQLLGAPMQEEMLLRCAADYQRHTDWHTRRPSFGGQS
ncbi:MAG: Asp-tRNA(Asn)/Glu-tRNA(Gln) amidotransferase subunit GatA [Myxococcales bacterium]|nr:Asp-tRNA(Asn)/Glu-tRNA(Gln) amidotransferase subunit GatA [Myxococcales bacterium]